jgi:hypothetical protein
MKIIGDSTTPLRLVAFLPHTDPLGGHCPSCGRLMDESGCRIVRRLISRDRTRTHGIGQIVDIDCTGAPVLPIVPCPSCEEPS